MSERFLTPRELSERWSGRVTVKTLANWRSGLKPKGPPYRKIGSRVLYALSAIITWEDANEFRSTSDYNERRGPWT